MTTYKNWSFSALLDSLPEGYRVAVEIEKCQVKMKLVISKLVEGAWVDQASVGCGNTPQARAKAAYTLVHNHTY